MASQTLATAGPGPIKNFHLAICHDGAVIALHTSQLWLISAKSVCRGPWQIFARHHGLEMHQTCTQGALAGLY